MVTENNLDPVMLSLGRALFAAQAYEMNLVTTLIALTMAKGAKPIGQDEVKRRKWLDVINRESIGKIKDRLIKLNLLTDEMINDIVEVNRKRITVAHHFADQWTDHLDDPEGRQKAIAQLDEFEALFVDAAARLYKLVGRLGKMKFLG